jgi:hypothetical protein
MATLQRLRDCRRRRLADLLHRVFRGKTGVLECA